MDRRILVFLCCLVLSSCASSAEYRVVGVDSLSGLSVSDGEASVFRAFSGIVVEPLYRDPGYDSACRLSEARAFVRETFSGKTVSLDDAGSVHLGEDSAELLLIRAGYAVPDMLSTAGSGRAELESAANEARKKSRGIWSPCLDTREANSSWTTIEASAPATVPIRETTIEVGPEIAPSVTVSPAPTAEKSPTPAGPSPAKSESTAAPADSGWFSCDPARKTCKAMKSCAEAKYFLANCGTNGMDGDKDGVPCEALCKGK